MITASYCKTRSNRTWPDPDPTDRIKLGSKPVQVPDLVSGARVQVDQWRPGYKSFSMEAGNRKLHEGRYKSKSRWSQPIMCVCFTIFLPLASSLTSTLFIFRDTNKENAAWQRVAAVPGVPGMWRAFVNARWLAVVVCSSASGRYDPWRRNHVNERLSNTSTAPMMAGHTGRFAALSPAVWTQHQRGWWGGVQYLSAATCLNWNDVEVVLASSTKD